MKFRLELSTLNTSRSPFSNFGSSDLRREVFHLSLYDAELLAQFIIYYISHLMLNYDFLFPGVGIKIGLASLLQTEFFFKQHFLGGGL